MMGNFLEKLMAPKNMEGFHQIHENIRRIKDAFLIDENIDLLLCEIKEIIERREAPPEVMETRMRMARIPEGATLIENPTGGPHGFQVENVFVLAGVPMVMQAMLSTITKERLGGGEPTRSLTVGAYLSEGQIGKKLGMIQEKHPDIDLGSYPFYNEDGYGTNLVMRGTDMVALKAILEEVNQMILSFGVEPIQE